MARASRERSAPDQTVSTVRLVRVAISATARAVSAVSPPAKGTWVV